MTPTATPPPAPGPPCGHCGYPGPYRPHCDTPKGCTWTRCTTCHALTDTTGRHAQLNGHPWTRTACRPPHTTTKEAA